MENTNHQQRIFLLLVTFRWVSLFPALWMILTDQNVGLNYLVTPGWVLLTALISTLFISLFHAKLNDLLMQKPYLLGLDLLFVGSLLVVSGGINSPYFLTSLSPLLAGAYFFQTKGGVIAAAVFTPLYLFAALINSTPTRDLLIQDQVNLFTQLAGFWLTTILFGYTSGLIEKLRSAHDTLVNVGEELTKQNLELAAAHNQLQIIYDLTTLLQSAPDVSSVQQRVLRVTIEELGFPFAAVGLVDSMSESLENWRTLSNENETTPKGITPLPLNPEQGLLIRAMLDQQIYQCSNEQDTALSVDPVLNEWLGEKGWTIIPLNLREHAVGVLLVASKNGEVIPEERLTVLKLVAGQAAVALGTTMLCVDRAQQLAIEQERNRIARDIHDTVAQSLFGIVFTLNACIKMLPEQAETVKRELADLHQAALQVRRQVRQSIFNLWPSKLNIDRFQTDLSNYVLQCGITQPFQVEFDIKGNFDSLSPALRRTLYRIAQEGLANAARHAQTDSALVQLRIENNAVNLTIIDEGIGFEPKVVMTRQRNREQFGLYGIQERAIALHGICEIDSKPGHGTRVAVQIPAAAEILEPQDQMSPKVQF